MAKKIVEVLIPVTAALRIGMEVDAEMSEDEVIALAYEKADFRIDVNRDEDDIIVHDIDFEELELHDKIVQGNVYYGCINTPEIAYEEEIDD